MTTETANNIAELLERGEFDKALQIADAHLAEHGEDNEIIFLRGKIHTRLGNTRAAINDFAHAKNNGHAKSAQAYEAAIEVLDFFNHDLYNP